MQDYINYLCRQTDGRTDTQTGGWTDRQTERDAWTDRQTHREAQRGTLAS